MMKTLITVAGLAGTLGVAAPAFADWYQPQPAPPVYGTPVQPPVYSYGYGYGDRDGDDYWRRRDEWRRHEAWERYRRWHHWQHERWEHEHGWGW